MDATIKAAWVAALRSGEYTQGFGKLVRQDPVTGGLCHCVMGVLCELAVKADVGVFLHAEVNGYKVFKYNGSRFLSPLLVNQWAGIADGGLRLNHEGSAKFVMALNDNKQLSFSVLADILEADHAI